MKKSLAITIGVLLSTGAASLVATADQGHDQQRTLRARLTGFQEPPAVVSTGTGRIKVVIHDDTLASYELSFENLEGDVTQSHIHLGQFSVNGGIMAFLCGGGGKPACPPSGTVTGTIVAADIMALPTQGIVAGDFAAFLDAIVNKAAYANVHSSVYGSGEIRGKLSN